MGARLKPLSLRVLTACYVGALMLIAGVSAAFHLASEKHYQQDKDLAFIQYQASRERMLLYRAASLAGQYELGDLTARPKLLSTVNEFATVYASLVANNLANPSPDAGTLRVRQIYCDGSCPMTNLVRRFVAQAQALVAQPPAPPGQPALLAKNLFASTGRPMLGPFDEVVQIQEHETQAALSNMNRLQVLTLAVILLTLAAEALLIFRPMIRMVGQRVEEAHKLARELAEQHERLRVTLRSIGDGVITTDAQGNVTWLNPVAEQLTGWSATEAQGRGLCEVFSIIHEDTRQVADNPVGICLAENRIVGLAPKTILLGRQGAEYPIEDSAAPIRNEAGETLGAVLVFHDVTEQRRLNSEMSHRATHDALTGLLNRSEFEVRLVSLLHVAQVDGTQNAMLCIDLDQFKLVNDTCGHAAGDQMLVQVAKLLLAVVRASDTVARLGGDEFGILLAHCPQAQAHALAQKICDTLETFRFTYMDQRFRVGASIGLVPVDLRWACASAIMNAADESCYAAKAAGRNRVHAWSDSDEKMQARHGEAQWATRLAGALDDNRFVLFAQRIYPIGTQGGGIHAELLIRMRELDGSLSQPGAFLTAAERFHMASRIDRWVLATAIEWMTQVPNLEAIELLCVNLSGQSVEDAAFHRWAIAMLADAGPRICSRICLEITETAAVTSMADAALFIGRLRAIGVRVALDDFGAGASSFGYLKSMPVDFLKIDGQFVRDILTDRLDEAAVRCFADVAAVVGMQTIAEFTDSEAVLQRLETIGIDFAQGYYLHKPAPIAELLEASHCFPGAAA
jgi:diguanylate cyclase (GGDEF)-like protein/PAS domain S-box-containing protein